MPGYYDHLTTHRVGQPESKRWQTTTRSALEETAHQLRTNTDRSVLIKEMADRKINNTKTSISFGNERINYTSDAMENQRRCQGTITNEERAQQRQRIKEMKAGLTATNFSIGDDRPLYSTANRDAMAEAESFAGTGRVAMNTQLKASIKASSLHFGNESVNYKSVAHDGMEYHGNENDFMKLKDDTREMTKQLRRHNFTFGEESVDYVSDYHRGYGSLPPESYSHSHEKKKLMKQQISDSRACHFTLGSDRPKYESNTHEALRVIDGNSPADVTAQLERAKAMRQALQKTTIVIGDDQEYM